MDGDSPPLAGSLAFLDEQYERWRREPTAVDPGFARLFEAGAIGDGAVATPPTVDGRGIDPRFAAVPMIVNAYRVRGHLMAQLDPLDAQPRKTHRDLDPATYGFGAADLATTVPAGGFHGADTLPLGELLRRLRETYCRTIGIEMMHITSYERRSFLQRAMEPSLNRTGPDSFGDRDTRVFMLSRLTAAEALERFVSAKYVGAKRFSLEGGESLIPLCDLVFEMAGRTGVEEIVMGMSHRGRLNVLYNLLGKPASDLFSEFEDLGAETMFGGGDVKYHLGHSADRVTRAGDRLHVSLAFNPSHLEAVDPVVVGRVRGKQRRRGDHEYKRVLGILIHGDSAFAGQGLVPETLNLSHLPGYETGGTVHVVVNNQIGFTTLPAAYRSTPYPTDVAKAIHAPIFHVNGDDPDAVAMTVRLAMDYRREFGSDVVIDLFCYRRFGHNEGDEPAFTQPLLYRKIATHPSTRTIYARRLVAEGVLSPAEAEAIETRQHAALEAEFARARAPSRWVSAGDGVWAGYLGGPEKDAPDPDTGVPREQLAAISARLTTVPEGFELHPKIRRLLDGRARMGRGEVALDWAMAEALAFGSLLWEDTLVRVTGQDTRRGTFSQRHAALVDQNTEAEYLPLEHLRDGQGRFHIYDSPLSEAAVLGFEYGYSLDFPDALVAWEAQFGDFVNCAQVLIDQFISSAEDKWKRLSGLVMLLPHGFEGQGPEHSSARFERFLTLCAEDNLQVCQPSTPAQYFHLLRRQVVRRWRKPLVVLTPKSLLRLPAARSPLAELSEGRFRCILDDGTVSEAARAGITRVLLCTGRIYYDLLAERARLGADATSIAIVRMEQLYPLREQELERILLGYPSLAELLWVQDEPHNMGARPFMYVRLRARAAELPRPASPPLKVRAVTRAESASPATGSSKAHAIEQQDILTRAFGPFDRI